MAKYTKIPIEIEATDWEPFLTIDTDSIARSDYDVYCQGILNKKTRQIHILEMGRIHNHES